MGNLGLVVNHRGAWPDKNRLDQLGIRNGAYIRSIVYDIDEFSKQAALLPADVKVIALLSSECRQVSDSGGDHKRWVEACEYAAAQWHGLVDIVELENEMDIKDQPARYTAQLITQAGPIFRDNGFQVAAGAVASSMWKDYLVQLRAECMSRGYEPDFYGLHPYAGSFEGHPVGWESVAEKVDYAYHTTRKPIICTEWGIKVGDAGGEQAHSDYIARGLEYFWNSDKVAVACLFAIHNNVGAPWERGLNGFGLLRDDGTMRQAFNVFSVKMQGFYPDRAPAPLSPRVGEGIAELLRIHGNTALSREHYISDHASFTLVQNGMYVPGPVVWMYDKDTNEVYEIPTRKVWK